MGAARETRRSHPLVELGALALGLVGYLLVRWATAGRTAEAVSNAREVLALERDLSLDVEHAVQTATVASAPWLGRLAAELYVWAYFPVLVVTAVWLYRRHHDSYRTLRTALLASGAVGLLVYAFFPCAPPWLADPRFADSVGQASLEAFARPALVMNELGAMPSFHCGWLALTAVVAWRATPSRAVRVLCVVLPVGMAVAVVVTGNHWVLDVPAGLALAGVGLLAAGALPAARHRRQHRLAGLASPP